MERGLHSETFAEMVDARRFNEFVSGRCFRQHANRPPARETIETSGDKRNG